MKLFRKGRDLGSPNIGFTLPELLVALVIGSLVVVVAASAMVNDLRVNSKSEITQRKRDEWKRAMSFIESEIAMGERIITDSSSIYVPQSCGFDDNDQVRLAIDIRRELPLIIYAVRNLSSNQKDWNPDALLKRCGPAIATVVPRSTIGLIDYTRGQPVSSVLLDGLKSSDTTSTCDGFCVSRTGSKSASFILRLRGLAGTNYQAGSATFSRVNSMEPYPVEMSACDRSCRGNLCNQNTSSTYILTGSSSSTNLTVNTGLDDTETSIMVCGLGYASSLVGSSTSRSNIIDPGQTSSLAANVSVPSTASNRNYLFGTLQNDTLRGANGDDTLVGRSGGDQLIGGGGNNIYRPWGNNSSTYGDTTVTGGSGMDTVFLGNMKEAFTIPSTCFSQTTCTLTIATPSRPASNPVKLTITNVDRLVFKNTRLDLIN